jgi:hypothetical protein
MKHESYFFNCSKENIDSIDPSLFSEISETIILLPKRPTQTEINNDLFWLFTSRGWAYDTRSGISDSAPAELKIGTQTAQKNNRDLCLTSTTLEASWHSDFAKSFPSGLVQIEAQFGKVEAMFKDFCGFRIARFERRLALGVQIVLSDPYSYFSHRRNAIGGMAYFEIAKRTLPPIGLDCPIWLIGVTE